MDASALLKSQGWRGKGFSLHPSDNSIGLAKPILLRRNTDGRGIGTKQHHTSDQWWLDAFDQKLKGLDTSKKGTITQSVTQGKLDVVVATGKNGKYTGTSGLYASFVRGESLVGTMSPETVTEPSTDATPADQDCEAVPRRPKETRLEKRARREARRLRKEEKVARRKAKDAKRIRKAAEKAAKKEAKEQGKRATKLTETREERRARRDVRRIRKEARRAKTKKTDEG